MDVLQDSTTALLRFRHSAGGSGVSRTGHIRPGGTLVVDYDAARLPAKIDTSGTLSDVVCHVRFLPGGQVAHGSVLGAPSTTSQLAVARQGPFEAKVPADATTVELWFEGHGTAGSTSWDSRYGANYTFAVVGEGLPVPEPSVALRLVARVDPSRIRVMEDAATKETTVVGSTGRLMQTGLVIRALVGGLAGEVQAWADIHVFDGSDELIHAGSVVLDRRESTLDGTLFVWEDVIYQGSGGGSGMGVWSRPDAHTVQYRLYCQPQRPAFEQEPVFTDAILHEFEVPADLDAGGG